MKLLTLLLLILQPITTLAYQSCPLLLPVLPPPPASSISTTTFLSTLNSALSTGVLGSTGDSFSLSLFSSTSPKPFFDFHHASPALNTSSNLGVKVVNGDTVYRIGSISKLLTVYLLLIEKKGDKVFGDSVTRWVPELKGKAGRDVDGGTAESVDWSSITIGELASQLAGLGRDDVFGELLTLNPGVPWSVLGFPIVNDNETLPCVFVGNCDRKDFFKSFLARHPVVPSGSTPIYSNAAFQILGYALESMMEKSYRSMFKSDMVDALKLTHTSFAPPDAKFGVIADVTAYEGWLLNIGDATPAGGIYSTTNDLSRIGQSILSSSLLKTALTRRWLKPHSHTADPLLDIGAPWEIQRYLFPPATASNTSPQQRVIDLYCKDGDIGIYSSKICVIPQWDIGFALLQAGGVEGLNGDLTTISNMIAETMFPALEEAARVAANANFAGRYVSADGKSYLSLATQQGGLGLLLTAWTSNGVDMFAIIVGERIASAPRVTLYPTGLVTKLGNGTQEVGWRAVIESTDQVVNGPFGGLCNSWAGVDAILYDGVAIDDFVFVVDKDGKALSANARVMRLALLRV